MKRKNKQKLQKKMQTVSIGLFPQNNQCSLFPQNEHSASEHRKQSSFSILLLGIKNRSEKKKKQKAALLSNPAAGNTEKTQPLFTAVPTQQFKIPLQLFQVQHKQSKKQNSMYILNRTNERAFRRSENSLLEDELTLRQRRFLRITYREVRIPKILHHF